MLDNSKSVIIVGSTSGMGRWSAIAFGKRGYRVVLAARDQEENIRVAEDVTARCNVAALTVPFDAEDYESHDTFLQQCAEANGGMPEGLVYFAGFMADQRAAEKDFVLARRMIDVNRGHRRSPRSLSWSSGLHHLLDMSIWRP